MNPIVVRSDKGYQTTMSIRQHMVLADEPLDAGGDDAGPMPLELFVGSLGACVAVTVRSYAERKGWPLEGINVEVNMARIKGEDYPGYTGDSPVVHEFREQITFEGPLSDEQRAQLMVIARKCPVRRALETPVFFVDETNESQPQL